MTRYCAPREGGDQGGKRVVVAEADLLDFRGTDGVVFVDHRHRTVGEDLLEAVLDAEMTSTGADVLVREQHLRDGEAVRGKGTLPGLHEQALAHRGAGLFSWRVLGTARKMEDAEAQADGA